MTLEKLTSLQDPNPKSPPSGGRRLPAALLPIGLLLAFMAIFGLMFGSRLLPVTEVRTAPVIALRIAAGKNEAPGSDSSLPAPVGQGKLLFQSSGWVEPDPYIINVPTLVSGVVREVLVLEGQSVKKNDVLATLIDDDAKLDVQEATQGIATLDATQVAHCAQLPVLNAEMHAVQERIKSEKALHAELLDTATRLASVRPGSVSAQEVRQAQLKVDAQKAVIDEATANLAGVLAKINKVDLERITLNARISAAQTELARRQLALERTVIKAPVDGIVLNLHAAPGKKRMLESDDPSSALIVELYEPGKLQARIDVPLTEAASLQVGQPVILTTDLLPDARFKGEVTRIVGQADLQRNTLQTKVHLHEPDVRLRPQMLVRAEFYPGGKADSETGPSSGGPRLAIFAPEEALFDRSQNSARAWIVEDGRARLRTLKVGSGEREQHLRIIDGLRPGDQVILPPFGDLEENQRVKITNPS